MSSQAFGQSLPGVHRSQKKLPHLGPSSTKSLHCQGLPATSIRPISRAKSHLCPPLSLNYRHIPSAKHQSGTVSTSKRQYSINAIAAKDKAQGYRPGGDPPIDRTGKSSLSAFPSIYRTLFAGRTGWRDLRNADAMSNSAAHLLCDGGGRCGSPDSQSHLSPGQCAPARDEPRSQQGCSSPLVHIVMLLDCCTEARGLDILLIAAHPASFCSRLHTHCLRRRRCR